MLTKSKETTGKELDLLANYPKANRNLKERLENKTDSDRNIARRFGKQFFDGDRRYGYGGFNYSPKFWQPVVPTFVDYWKIGPGFKLLDVGCAKGFMLFDFLQIVEGIEVAGIDISDYAIENAISPVADFVQVANAKLLPFEDNSFDGIISINTIHNLEINECFQAIREIERVSKGNSFITVDAYSNSQEKERMMAWNLTAKTILSINDWKSLFNEAGYTGDYYWFMP